MPKKAFEIRDIRGGVVTNASSVDMPKNTVATMLNVDPTIEHGKIGGFKADQQYVIGTNTDLYTDMFKFIDFKGSRYIVYNKIVDSPSSKTLHYASVSTGTSTSLSFTNPIHLEQVGQTIRATRAANYPIFIGSINHDQFGADPPPVSGLDARLLPIDSTASSGLYKAVRDAAGTVTGTKAYVGINYKGDEVYLCSQNGSTIWSSGSVLDITSTLAICVESKLGLILVYDDDGSEFGRILVLQIVPAGDTYKIEIVNTLIMCGSSDNPFLIKDWGERGQYVTDMEVTIDPDPHAGATDWLYIWFALYDFSVAGRIVVDSKYRSTPNDVDDEDSLHGYPTFLWRSSLSYKPEDLHDGVDVGDVGVMNCSPIFDACYDFEGDTWRHGRFYTGDDGENSSKFFWMEQFMRPLHNKNYSSEHVEHIGYLCNFYKDEESDIEPSVVLYTTFGVSFDANHITGVCSLFCSPRYSFTAVDGGRNFPFGHEGGWYGGIGSNFSQFNGRRISSSLDEFQNGPIGADNCCMFPIYHSITSNYSRILLLSGKIYLFGGNFDVSRESFMKVESTSKESGVASTGIKHLSGPVRTNNDSYYLSGGYVFVIGSTHPSDVVKAMKLVYPTGANASFNVNYRITEFSISDFNIVAQGSAYVIVSGSSAIDAPGHMQGETYRYYLALEYDGNQISPLSRSLGSLTVTSKDRGALIKLHLLKSDTGFNDRVTAVRFFKTKNGGLTGTYESIPREINRIDIIKAVRSNTNYYIFNVKDNNEQGATFQDIAGFPHTAEITTPLYTICHWDGFNMYIAGCTGITDLEADNFIFKSEPGRADQFDLYGKFVNVAYAPIAISSIGEYAYVFTANGGYIIDKQSFSQVGYDERLSVVGSKHVRRTPIGLILANKNGLYINQGKGWVDVSAKIMRSTIRDCNDEYLSWDRITLASNDDCCIGYDPVRELAIVKITLGRLSYALCIDAEMSIFPVEFEFTPVWFEVAPGTRKVVYARPSATASVGRVATFATSSILYRKYSLETQQIDLGNGLVTKMFYKAFITCPLYNYEQIKVKNTNEELDLRTTGLDNGVAYSLVDEAQLEQHSVSVSISKMPGHKLTDSIGVVYRAHHTER